MDIFFLLISGEFRNLWNNLTTLEANVLTFLNRFDRMAVSKNAKHQDQDNQLIFYVILYNGNV